MSRNNFLISVEQFFRRFFLQCLFRQLPPSVFSLIAKLLSQSLPITVLNPFSAISDRNSSNVLAPDSTCPIMAPRKLIWLLLKSMYFSFFLSDLSLESFPNIFWIRAFVNLVTGEPVSERAWNGLQLNVPLKTNGLFTSLSMLSR